MPNLTIRLSSEEADGLQGLARLMGKSDSALASSVVKDFVVESLADKEIAAGLRAIHKLSAGRASRTKAPSRSARPPRETRNDPSRARSRGVAVARLGQAAERTGASRSSLKRDLANVADGTEVYFRDVRALTRQGRMVVDRRAEPFNSHSSAAVFVAKGGSFNGWVVWKDSRGRNLAELHRLNVGW